MVDESVAKRKSSAGLADTLRFNLKYVVPNVLQGAFLRRPAWVRLFAWLNNGVLSPGLAPRLKALYGREAIRIRFLRTPSWLLFDRRAIEHVLQESPKTYGPAAAKRKGMSHFQPEAVTVSSAAEWPARRAFNDAALGRSGHGHFASIHAIVADECRVFARKDALTWPDFSDVFRNITLRTIFGRSGEREQQITRLLRRLMSRANLPFLPRKVRLLDSYRTLLKDAVDTAEAGSLGALARSQAQNPAVPIADQVTHWLFAMNDTLGENVVRAAAAIHSFAATRERARSEVESAKGSSAAAVSAFPYLAACLEETMRLWPSTPFLLREAVAEDSLCGHRIQRGDQIVIPNIFNHVDPTALERALEWFPERWLQQQKPGGFYHLSAGPQACPGAAIARFIGTSVLAEIIGYGDYITSRPRLHSERRLPASLNPFSVRLQAMGRRPVTGGFN